MYNGMLDILFDKVIFRSKVLISLNGATVPYYFSFNLSQIGSFLKQKKKCFVIWVKKALRTSKLPKMTIFPVN